MEDGRTRGRSEKVETDVKLKAIIEEQEHDLNVRIDGGRVRAEFGDRVYDLELREPETGSYLFLSETELHECDVSKAAEGFDVSLYGRTNVIANVDSKI